MEKILNQQDMKDINLNSVFRLIRRAGPVTRRQIEAELDLSWGAVSGTVARLLRAGYIKEVKAKAPSGAGRTPIALAINPDDHFLLGLDINRSGLGGVLTALDGRVLFSLSREATAVDRDGQIQEIENLIRALLEQAKGKRVETIGIAMQGAVDSERGISASFPIPDWHDVPLAELLSEDFNLPVFLEHDPDCILYAASAGRDLQDAILLRVDKGTGMAVMLDGRIIKRFGAFEPGFTLLEDGRRLDDAITLRGLADKAKIPFTKLAENARNGHENAITLFKNLAKHLALAIVNLSHIFRVNSFLLCGKMMDCRDLFWQELLSMAEALASTRGLHIDITEVKNAAVGAALLATERHTVSFE